MNFKRFNCLILLSGAFCLLNSVAAADAPRELLKSKLTAQDIIKAASLREDPKGNFQKNNFTISCSVKTTFDFSKTLPGVPLNSINGSRKAIVFQDKFYDFIQHENENNDFVLIVSIPGKCWIRTPKKINQISPLSKINYFSDEKTLKYPHLAILNSPEIQAAWPNGYVVQGPDGAKNFFDSKYNLKKVDITTISATFEDIQPCGDYFEPRKIITERYVWPPMRVINEFDNVEIKLNEPVDEMVFSVPADLPPLPDYQKEWAIIESQRIELPEKELKPYHDFMFFAQYKLENVNTKSKFEFRIRQFMNAKDAKKFYHSNAKASDIQTRWRRSNVIMEIITPLDESNKNLLEELKAEKNIIDNYLSI